MGQSVKKTEEEEKGIFIILIFFICLSLMSGIFILINLYQIDNLKNDISQKNMIIDKLQSRDSLYHQFINDGIGNINRNGGVFYGEKVKVRTAPGGLYKTHL